ncbi:MAG TPA: hypothetical protein VGG45_00645 [Terracidiphilus sp.]|jgi:hypothetical protein
MTPHPTRRPGRHHALALARLRKSESSRRPAVAFALLSIALLFLAACHSYHIDSTVENRTGADVQLLEVDYPWASFGVDRIASGAIYHYRFQVNGSGPLKIIYTGVGNKQVQITGPALDFHQQGQLKIVLLPAGKAQFIPQLSNPG